MSPTLLVRLSISLCYLQRIWLENVVWSIFWKKLTKNLVYLASKVELEEALFHHWRWPKLLDASPLPLTSILLNFFSTLVLILVLPVGVRRRHGERTMYETPTGKVFKKIVEKLHEKKLETDNKKYMVFSMWKGRAVRTCAKRGFILSQVPESNSLFVHLGSINVPSNKSFGCMPYFISNKIK